MKFDIRYKTKIPLYKRGRCDGPSTYTYKKDGFRLHWLNYATRCNFCEKSTNWGMTYFYPDERFKDWKQRDISTYRICSEEEIPLLKVSVLEDKINSTRTLNFVPRTKNVKRNLKQMENKPSTIKRLV